MLVHRDDDSGTIMVAASVLGSSSVAGIECLKSAAKMYVLKVQTDGCGGLGYSLADAISPFG